MFAPIQSQLNKLNDQFDAVIEHPFVNTLLLNIATIAAIIVGVVSYAYSGLREWYNNGGKHQIINNSCKVLQFVNKTAEGIYYKLEDAEPTV
ncbi:hypothetical protein SSZBM1_13 [Synechococcus phage S-SZBM1]|uniref:Uncharacterized protein n=1 Tax=Synechococcus phage S-SZBM1 TaxID=2926475 RepID=A0AC61TTK2_9CAUD|nr:hypothetical protein PP650_gp013 [Synechococcus phage S-SZBM1]UNH61130.1 hypothetical protein SSZBM1_13 [Synechococcus phage S-SZBM1]